MTTATQPPAPRPSLLPPARRREIVRWIGGGLAGCFFGVLIFAPELFVAFFRQFQPLSFSSPRLCSFVLSHYSHLTRQRR